MAVSTRLRLFYLFHFAKPAADRPIYESIHERRVQSILELGIGDGQRARRMIEVASLHVPAGQIQYAAIDLFEAGSSNEGTRLDLKGAYRLLCATGARVRLLPGDPLTVLSRTANSLGRFDLVVVSAGLDSQAMAAAWFFVPRLLHGESRVCLRNLPDSGGTAHRLLLPAEVETLAAKTRPRRAA